MYITDWREKKLNTKNPELLQQFSDKLIKKNILVYLYIDVGRRL